MRAQSRVQWFERKAITRSGARERRPHFATALAERAHERAKPRRRRAVDLSGACTNNHAHDSRATSRKRSNASAHQCRTNTLRHEARHRTCARTTKKPRRGELTVLISLFSGTASMTSSSSLSSRLPKCRRDRVRPPAALLEQPPKAAQTSRGHARGRHALRASRHGEARCRAANGHSAPGRRRRARLLPGHGGNVKERSRTRTWGPRASSTNAPRRARALIRPAKIARFLFRIPLVVVDAAARRLEP